MKLFRSTILIALLLLALFTGCASDTVSSKSGQTIDATAATKLIRGISMSQSPDAVTVTVQGTAPAPLTYTSVKQPSPLAVILYFPGTAFDNVTGPNVGDNETIAAISTAELIESGHTARIKIALKNDVSYSVVREAADLKIVFVRALTEKIAAADLSNTGALSPAADQVAPKIADTVFESNPIETSVQEKNLTPVPDMAKQVVSDSQPAWVNRIDFSSEEAGKSTIVIGTTRPISYTLQKTAEKALALNLAETKIPEYRQRPLITTRFPSAVDMIVPSQGSGNITSVAIRMRESVPYFVEQTDDILMIHFEASSIPPRPLDASSQPAWQRAMTQGQQSDFSSKAPVSMAVEQSAVLKPKAIKPYMKSSKQYGGQKIALDFYDTDIKNVFRILMQISGNNFAVDKDVTGKVTLNLDNPVPWDQVLDLILKMNGLGQVTEGNIIRIAKQETLTREEDQLRAKFEARQKAQQQVKALEPLVTEYIAVSYSNAKSDILPHLEKIITKDRGSLSVDERTNQVIITDTPDKIAKARQIVQQIDKVTPQVIIEARIVETTTNFSRELGTEWGVSGNSASSSLGGDLGWDMAMNLPVDAVGTIGVNFSRLIGSTLALDAQLQAMESLEQGKIVSSPRVVTLDNKKAMIKQGYEFPYSTTDDDGDVNIEFKDIDLKLEVTPHITSDNRISLNVHITKNDIFVLTEEAPALTTKEAETELLVNDGDTFVIGGIIKSNTNITDSGVPGLMKIPLLRWLFKNEQKSTSKDELLIFITPRIVQLEQRNNL
jgi:type IV pilus assembly protein PilQ